MVAGGGGRGRLKARPWPAGQGGRRDVEFHSPAQRTQRGGTSCDGGSSSPPLAGTQSHGRERRPSGAAATGSPACIAEQCISLARDSDGTTGTTPTPAPSSPVTRSSPTLGMAGAGVVGRGKRGIGRQDRCSAARCSCHQLATPMDPRASVRVEISETRHDEERPGRVGISRPGKPSAHTEAALAHVLQQPGQKPSQAASARLLRLRLAGSHTNMSLGPEATPGTAWR